MLKELKIGMTENLVHVVVPADLATHWKNDVEVLATPILLWLSEIACMAAIDGCLDADEMTVGYSHMMKHMAPTPVNQTIHIQSTLVDIQDKKLCFQIHATDDSEVILEGYHERYLINRTRFLNRIEKKKLNGKEI